MEGVFLTPAELDESHNQSFPLIPTNIHVEDTIPTSLVFGVSNLAPHETNTEQMNVALEENVIIADVDMINPINPDIIPTEETIEEPVYKRPRRAAAIAATKTIKNVLKWEKCRESSSMFRNAAHEINKEFDLVTRHGQKKKTKPSSQGIPFPFVATSLAIGSSTSVPSDTNPVEVEAILSDDECEALKSDEEDNDDDANESDDDAGSLQSFVVDDDYISDDEDCDTSEKKTHEESQSESDSDEDDTCSDEEDEVVQCDDDSDADASVESESEVGSDVIDDEALDQMDEMDSDENGVNHINEGETAFHEVVANDMQTDQLKNDGVFIEKTNHIVVDVNTSCSVELVESVDVSVVELATIPVDLSHESMELSHEYVDLSHNNLFSGPTYELDNSPCNVDNFFAGG